MKKHAPKNYDQKQVFFTYKEIAERAKTINRDEIGMPKLHVSNSLNNRVAYSAKGDTYVDRERRSNVNKVFLRHAVSASQYKKYFPCELCARQVGKKWRILQADKKRQGGYQHLHCFRHLETKYLER